jgi:hypothetical protein
MLPIKHRFIFYKYVVKVLMSAIDNWFDLLDEHRVDGSGSGDRHGNKTKKKSTCCIL